MDVEGVIAIQEGWKAILDTLKSEEWIMGEGLKGFEILILVRGVFTLDFALKDALPFLLSFDSTGGSPQ